MKPFNDLILAHKGKRICVMGGAPTLADHMATVQADVVISINAHGVDICKPDYMLAMDAHYWGTETPLWKYLRSKSDAPIINPEEWADYRLGYWPAYPKRYVLSGMVGAWAAWAMGAKVVILAGMDGYGGAPSKMAHSTEPAKEIRCPVRVVGGGPLTKFWPEYNAGERFPRYKPHSTINGLLGIDGMITLQAVKARHMCGKEREKGEIFQAMRHDAALWLRHKLVIEL